MKEKINLIQLGRGLPHFYATLAGIIDIISGHANKIVLSKLLVTVLWDDPVILKGDLEVLTGDHEDPTLLGEGSNFLIEAQTKAQEF